MKKLAAVLIALNVLAWAFVVPRLWAVGSLTIPNTISAQPAGNLAASLLDSNWTTIATYVNNREVTTGALSTRPVAGTAGRWFFVTDVAGGVLFIDNGSSWVQVAGPINASGTVSNVRGLLAGTASLTVINASATLVNLRNPSDGSIVIRAATSTLTNTITVAGPIANGQDQAAAFAASSWIHDYYIWNGATLATLTSTCAPSDANGSCSGNFGPNLPTGYTHWAYIGAYRLNASSQLLAAQQRGSRITYTATQNAWLTSTGVASENRVNVASLSAPNALGYTAHYSQTAQAGSENVTIRLLPGVVWWQQIDPAVSGVPLLTLQIPELSRQEFYFQITTTARVVRVDIGGYQVPNGAE